MVKMSVDCGDMNGDICKVIFSIPNGYSEEKRGKMQKLLLDTEVRLNRIYNEDSPSRT